jgi:hypothetical protein
MLCRHRTSSFPFLLPKYTSLFLSLKYGVIISEYSISIIPVVVLKYYAVIREDAYPRFY